MESYSLKKRKATSYAEVNLLHLPKPMKRKREAKLYPVLVIEEDKENGRVKVHYVGYSTKFDEWKDTDEIEDLPGKDTPDVTEKLNGAPRVEELAYQIKKRLLSTRKSSPLVSIEVPLDLTTFQSELTSCGSKLGRSVRGQPVYGILQHSDLNAAFGEDWHIRLLNTGGDFCYCHKGSVEFYIRRRKDIVEVEKGGKASTTA
jgi:hypothetical protein